MVLRKNQAIGYECSSGLTGANAGLYAIADGNAGRECPGGIAALWGIVSPGSSHDASWRRGADEADDGGHEGFGYRETDAEHSARDGTDDARDVPGRPKSVINYSL